MTVVFLRRAWSILSNLTGGHYPRHCPVSTDAAAPQLVRNVRYEAVYPKLPGLIS